MVMTVFFCSQKKATDEVGLVDWRGSDIKNFLICFKDIKSKFF